MAALGSCSHCFHAASTDSGARTITFSGLYFDTTVAKRIIYQFPYRDIFYDLDGTLTGLGPKTWATPYFEHNEQPECQKNLDVYNGLICNSSVQVRRLAMWGYSPNIFELMEIKILKIDDLGGMDATAKEAYLDDKTQYSVIPFKPMLDPMNGWAVPYVTGHRYKVHWRYGLDFTKMRIDLSPRWVPDDNDVYMVFNFTDVRAQVDVITGGDTIANTTLTTKASSQWQTGDNVVYNDTATREIHLVVNGKNTTRTSVQMVGYRCVGSCLGEIDDVPIEINTRRWSNPQSWDSGKVPVSGQDVEIKSGWNMIYDVAESPVVNLLTINGRLTFENGKDLHLHAKYIFIRAGELIIGEQSAPFLTTAKITLHGEKANQHIVYDNAVEAGNKLIANTGKFQAYGTRRIGMSRLRQTAMPNDITVLVDPGLDWQIGDKLAFAPTSLRYADSDYAIIVNYDNATGQITLDRKLSYQHYGAPSSTAPDYSGVDMRGEVMMMTRNVIVAGEDIEAWGCQIVTSDFLELSGVLRQGQTILDSVEIHNCSQYDTEKAALRFEGSGGRFSSVTNSAIRHGLGRGIQITSASSVHLSGNIIFDFYKIGLNIETSKNITVDSNIIVRVLPRQVIALDMITDLTGGVFSCALDEFDVCSDLKFTNNIVAGVINTGYSVYAHECGDYNTVVFRNNIAHSVLGTGAIIFRNPNSATQAQCLEGSYFAAYKNTLDGAVTYSSTAKAVFTNMVMIDNGYGATVQIGQEGDKLQAQMRNIVTYGETEARDCLKEDECVGSTKDGCIDRVGVTLSYFSTGGKPPLVKKLSALPYRKIKSDASYGGDTYYENLTFKNFKTQKTFCGNKQRLIGLNDHASDYIPRAKFYGTRFEVSTLQVNLYQNVHQDSVSYLYTPPQGWANIDDCGNFPCTAPLNALIMFDKTSYSGITTPARTDQAFQIIANNQPNANYPGCRYVQMWNAYHCTNENLGVLLFESLDEDKMKRMITPIIVKNDALNVSNTLNTFMDHIWDGFYTGQLRMSRWPAVVQVGNNQKYDIQYSGTPPNSQRFTLIADYSALTVRIKYPKAGAYIVQDSKGKRYEANQWDDTLQQPANIKGLQCGENRYVGVVNILEFYLTSGCTVYIQPIDSIQSSVRLNWTLSAFYADGGTTKFIDRMAASLGIHASNIKVVSVYTGSVVVVFQIVDGTRPTVGLPIIRDRLASQIASSKLWLGAPILNAEIKGVPVKIVTDADAGTGGNGNNGGNNGGGNGNGGNTNNTNGTNGTSQSDSNTNTTTKIDNNKQPIHEEKDNRMVLIIVICVIVALIIASGVIGYCIFRKCKKSKAKDDKNSVIQSQPIEQDASKFQSNVGGPEEDHFEPQYHPKTDIDIFSRGDPLKKANEADSVVENRSHNDTDGDEEIQGHNYTNQSNLADIQVIEDTQLSLHNFHSPQRNMRVDPRKQQQVMRTTVDEDYIMKKKTSSPMSNL